MIARSREVLGVRCEARGASSYQRAHPLTASVALPQDPDAMPVDSETVRVGSEAPDFTLEAIDGSQVSLSSYRGKPVVLVFLRGFR